MRLLEKSRIVFFYSLLLIFFLNYSENISAQTCSGTIVKPSISISTNSTLICTGKAVSFFATSTNAGANPSYQWKVNSINEGSNNDTFTISSLKNGDVVNCVLTADATFPCALPKTAASYGIVINVSNATPPSINISVAQNNVCPGAPMMFTASTQNASESVLYQWMLNDSDIGSDSATFSSNDLKNNDEVYCTLVDSSGCSSEPVASNKIGIIIKDTPIVTVNPADTFVTPGSIVTLTAIVANSISGFEWQPAQGLSSTSSLSTITQPIFANTNYYFTATNNDGCTSTKEIFITILHDLLMPNAFTPNGDGHNDVFRIPAVTDINLQEFSIYDRWGKKVFSTANISEGWDGTLENKKEDSGNLYLYHKRLFKKREY